MRMGCGQDISIDRHVVDQSESTQNADIFKSEYFYEVYDN